jgi:hypothetical protein
MTGAKSGFSGVLGRPDVRILGPLLCRRSGRLTTELVGIGGGALSGNIALILEDTLPRRSADPSCCDERLRELPTGPLLRSGLVFLSLGLNASFSRPAGEGDLFLEVSGGARRLLFRFCEDSDALWVNDAVGGFS